MLTILLELFAAGVLAYAAFLVIFLAMGLIGVAATNTSDALRRLWRRVTSSHQWSP